MKKKLILSTLLLLLFLFSINAQNSINGIINDAFKTPVPFANIILHKQGGDKLPKGVISDDDGTYLFVNIPNGNYQLEISVLGFEVKKSEELAKTFHSLPNDRILVETDSPYLSPEPLRGKPNEPSNIIHTVSTATSPRCC